MDKRWSYWRIFVTYGRISIWMLICIWIAPISSQWTDICNRGGGWFKTLVNKRERIKPKKHLCIFIFWAIIGLFHLLLQGWETKEKIVNSKLYEQTPTFSFFCSFPFWTPQPQHSSLSWVLWALKYSYYGSVRWLHPFFVSLSMTTQKWIWLYYFRH